MNIQLSEHFTYGKLLRFTLPSIVMMAFSSIYGVVDGVFVSNFVGADPFAAVNLIMPFLMILGAVGFMLGTGGSALVAYMLGVGNERKANETFSLLMYVLITLGAIFTVLGLLFLESVARLLGADETLLPYCVSYGRVILIALIPFMLQNAFQSFLVTAERPHFGLYITIAAGVTNIVLDALFIAVLRLGVVGAALATTISQYIGGVIPLLNFIFPNNSKLGLCRARLDLRAIAEEEFPLDARLPWEHVSPGVSRGFLLREWRRALAGKTTDDCTRSSCTGCGICPTLGAENVLVGDRS